MVIGQIVRPRELETKREKSGRKLKDKAIGDIVWVPDKKTNLLVKVEIVHEYHVPGAYTQAVKKYESNPDNIVWAKHDLGNGHFSWFALYADADADIAPEGISEADKFNNYYNNKLFRTAPDETSSQEFIKKYY